MLTSRSRFVGERMWMPITTSTMIRLKSDGYAGAITPASIIMGKTSSRGGHLTDFINFDLR